MSSSVIISYYILLLLSVLFYLKKRNRKYINIRDVIFALTFFTTSVGGVFCAYGYASSELWSFRFNVLLCYILFFLIITISFTLIDNKSIFKFGRSLDVSISDSAIWFVYGFILLYTIAYFVYLRDIPLISLLKSGDTTSAAMARLEVTHNITEHYDLPIVFRYARFIRDTPMSLLTCLAFLKYHYNRKYKTMFFVILITTIFYQTYALEKAGLIYIILILFFCYIQTLKKVSEANLKMIFVFALIVLCLYAMYSFFMGQDENVFESVFNRTCLRQTGWIYFQDKLLDTRYGGCLYGEGISIFLFDSLLGRSPVALTKEVYDLFYTQYSNEGYTGTTGGMPLFYLYSNLGFLIGGIIFYFMCYVVAKIDNTFLMNKANSSKLRIACYATFLSLSIQGYMSNMSTIFMLPFIWSPHVLSLILTVICLKKLS